MNINITNKDSLRQGRPNPKSYYSVYISDNDIVSAVLDPDGGLTGTWADLKKKLEGIIGKDASIDVKLIPVEDVVTFTKVGETLRAISRGYYRDFDSIEDIYNFIVEKQIRNIHTGDILVKVYKEPVVLPDDLVFTHKDLEKSISGTSLDFVGTLPHTNSPRPGWKKLSVRKFLAESRDFLKDIDSQAIKYTIANLNDAEAKGVLSQYKKFQKLLDGAKDIKEETKYWYQMFLDPSMAENNMKKFFAKTKMENRYKYDKLSKEAARTGDVVNKDIDNETTAVILGYKKVNNIKLTNFDKLDVEPSEADELVDLGDTQKTFDDIFSLLDDRERMYLTASLIMGINQANSRAYSDGYGNGVDLRKFMSKPPLFEINQLEKKIDKLERAGKRPKRGYSLTSILTDFDGVVDKNGSILFAGKQRIPQALETIKSKLMKSGNDSILSAIGMSESVKGSLLGSVLTILKGGKILRKDLIHCIVSFVNFNKKEGIEMKYSGKITDVARKFLTLSKSKKLDDLSNFYDLFLAPVVKQVKSDNPKHFLNFV